MRFLIEKTFVRELILSIIDAIVFGSKSEII